MPFASVEFVTTAPRDSRASISYKRPGKGLRGPAQPRLVIGLPLTICKDFKFGDKQRFALQVGDGADKGKGRIVLAPVGVPARILKGGAVFRFGYVPMLGEDAAEKEFVEAQPIKDGFEIVLPPWFKADEPAPVRRKA